MEDATLTTKFRSSLVRVMTQTVHYINIAYPPFSIKNQVLSSCGKTGSRR